MATQDSASSAEDTVATTGEEDQQEHKPDDPLVGRLTSSIRSALLYAQEGSEDSQNGFSLDKEKFDGLIYRLIEQKESVKKAKEILGDPDFCPGTIHGLLDCIDEARSSGDPSPEKRGLDIPEDIKDGFAVVGMIVTGLLASTAAAVLSFVPVLVSPCLLFATGVISADSLRRLVPRRWRSQPSHVNDVELQPQAPASASRDNTSG
ncbi:hypothetical protein QFC20_003906 [Naganishia adeliensis]|uniref:Uncharacterized protein n=1 Tax=Naganishia adeliensis TaxID=92952 RepID=A0ACC2W5A7_9TREE|nr:hypothetical protein QFC20_003906 [Naganishia adeliensis]